MKRFSLIVSLMALLLLSANAFAAWDVTIESKNASMGQTGVTLAINCSHDLNMGGFTVPIIVREVDAGSFWAGALPYDTNGSAFVPGQSLGVTWSWPSGGVNGRSTWAALLLESRPGVPADPCATDGDLGYDGVTPDHFCINASGAGGAEPAHPASYTCVTLTFNVTAVAGAFDFDTACFTGSLGTIYMIDDAFPPVDHGPTGTGEATFHKGTITIIPNPCPVGIGSYPAGPNGIEGALLQNAWNSAGYDDGGEPGAPNFYMVSGPGDVNLTTGAWSWQTGACDAGPYTVVIEVADAAHTGGGGCPANTLTFSGSVTAVNPAITNCTDFTIHWDETVNYTFLATGWAPLVWDPSADFTYTPGCALGVHDFSVMVTDACDRTASCDFTVTVTNGVVVCNTTNYAFLWSNGFTLDLNALYTDPDGDALEFSNLTFNPDPDNDPVLAGGVITWSPAATDGPETYELCYDIFDGCQTVHCCFEVDVQFSLPAFKVSVLQFEETDLDDVLLDNYTHELSGRNATMGVFIKSDFGADTLYQLGGFDLLLCYDQSVLALKEVARGDAIVGWEYFTYRTGAFGQNCGSACPSGYLRLIGIREMNNGIPSTGATYLDPDLPIAELTFYISEDRDLIGMCARIGFCAIDCGDNVLSSDDGNTLWLPHDGPFGPDTLITFGYDYPDDCDDPLKAGHEAEKLIWFDPGYICIVPPTDDRGDINLNGIANEIADAVLFTNYFIYGPDAVWDPIYFENQILATDINDDGIVTTVADLVYLIRIITGDAIPYGESGDGAKVNPYASALDVNAEMVDGNMVITTNSSSDLGAGHLVFHYTGLTVGAPTTNTGLDVKSNAANGELRVLVYSMQHNTVNAGVTQFVTIPVEGNGSIELVSAEFSDAAGNLMATTMFRVAPPTAFELMQNYPNPFNASTQIRFALPVASNWSLNIYNVAGQIVKSFEGSSEAGVVSVNWNADVASGIYFYKLTADNFTATKKMVLMK